MKTKIPTEVIQFYLQNGTVTGGSNTNTYTFMPFYLEVIDADKGIVVFHPLGNLPAELKDIIKIHRS